jgi:hypothetical protein
MKYTLTTILTIALLLSPFLVYRHFRLQTIKDVTFTVEELPPRIGQRGDEYVNLVYTDQGTFSNKDTWFPWKTRSTDVRNQLKEGETFTCEISGWRVGFLSMYRNITDCEGFEYN